MIVLRGSGSIHVDKLEQLGKFEQLGALSRLEEVCLSPSSSPENAQEGLTGAPRREPVRLGRESPDTPPQARSTDVVCRRLAVDGAFQEVTDENLDELLAAELAERESRPRLVVLQGGGEASGSQA